MLSINLHNYCILPSKHPPPIFDESMVCVYMYIHYTYKWLPRVSSHPRFLAREFQVPMCAYLEDYIYDTCVLFGEYMCVHVEVVPLCPCRTLGGARLSTWPLLTDTPESWMSSCSTRVRGRDSGEHVHVAHCTCSTLYIHVCMYMYCA